MSDTIKLQKIDKEFKKGGWFYPEDANEMVQEINKLIDKVDYDTEMSDTSEKAVQNKVIKGYVDDGLDTLQEQVNTNTNKINSIVDVIYPVGSIYISANDVDPSKLFGGTWEAFGQGRTLIGAGTGNDGTTSKTFKTGDTGGEYVHSHNAGENMYALTSFYYNGTLSKMGIGVKLQRTEKWGPDWFIGSDAYTDTNAETEYGTMIKGVTDGAETLSPYITVNIWRRTS